MNINITLLGQMITFALLVWFTMKFVWPPVIRAMAERQKQIADGLAAADRGRHELDLAHKKGAEILREARQSAEEIIAEAGKRASHLIAEAKDQARLEGERLLAAARAELEMEGARARENLRAAVASLAVAAASRVLEKEIDEKAHGRLLEAVIKEL